MDIIYCTNETILHSPPPFSAAVPWVLHYSVWRSSTLYPMKWQAWYWSSKWYFLSKFSRYWIQPKPLRMRWSTIWKCQMPKLYWKTFCQQIFSCENLRPSLWTARIVLVKSLVLRLRSLMGQCECSVYQLIHYITMVHLHLNYVRTYITWKWDNVCVNWFIQ